MTSRGSLPTSTTLWWQQLSEEDHSGFCIHATMVTVRLFSLKTENQLYKADAKYPLREGLILVYATGRDFSSMGSSVLGRLRKGIQILDYYLHC